MKDVADDRGSAKVTDDDPRLTNDFKPSMVRRVKQVLARERATPPDPLVDDPSVDLATYRRVMRIELADFALSRHRIYLDMNYWIWLRDAAFVRSECPIHRELWQNLVKLKATGRLICPISYPVYVEVRKQSDQSMRRTACVIDRLCGGICIVDQFARVAAQVSHFVWTKLLGDLTLPPANRFVWATVSDIVGAGHFEMKELSAETNIKLQKMWLRFMQHFRFSDMIQQMQGGRADRQDNWRHTLLQNFMSGWTRDRLRSLTATYKIEVGGSIDLIANDIADFAADLFAKGIRSPLGPETSPQDLAASLASIITAGLKLGRITTDCPQYHIAGVIHATIRWMRRKHQINDLMDHQHATAALPYCHAFFTERDMRDTLTRGPFKLANSYGCRVISDPNEALQYVIDLVKEQE